MKIIGTFLTVCGLAAAQSSQAPNPVQQSTENAARMAGGAMPIYRVTVVERTTKAINYNHRSGSTNIDFRGTSLLPEARGEATVESKQGVIKIDARMEKLQPATKFGPEYLTYVMWAITPEGRATNVGEVLLNGDKTKLDATTELQSFGLIVTAEPYFAVTQPSDVVVMENFVRKDTVGTIEQVDAKVRALTAGPVHLEREPGRDQAPAAELERHWSSTRREMPSRLHAGPAPKIRPRNLPEGRPGPGECRGLSDGQSGKQAHWHGGARGRPDGRGCPHHHRKEDRRGAAGQRAPGRGGPRGASRERPQRGASRHALLVTRDADAAQACRAVRSRPREAGKRREDGGRSE
jgi:hypothetical protein